MKQLLENYRALVGRVDAHIRNVEGNYKDLIACRKGCDSCCRPLTLFPVEAMAVSLAFERLPENIKNQVIRQADISKALCPLLIKNSCIIYDDRPVICRTHGFPILIEKDGSPAVDFCPKNFKGIASFPGEMLLSVEQLNQTFFAVNAHFLESIETDETLPDRIHISDALLWIRDTL